MQAPAEGWEARILRESEQDKQSVESGPEQVRQSPWQFVQVVSEALNWLEAQGVQLPGVGLVGLTFPATQVRHWFEAAPEQVEQSE